ncbi:HK97-gp10 family putative phage morphogenesis protein [Sphingobium chungbukense]|uniref:HK97 gp10 family phage protein n=1 Tax=Sphingobium chungbukense TaxID=56193 RepID=A0A0M3AVB7_9SPHN|nr:HK97 gp10 family phage protein [Sphingobium chungbukense]KKW93873.1 hypothetical protein YP76_04240 [Sphingobium chungbukense]
MARRSVSRLEGFREASRQLNEMSKAMARNVGKRALADTAEILARGVRQNVGPHNLTGDTYESVDVEPAKQRRGVAVQVVLADIAGVELEFGNSAQTATPVFRPAVDSNRQKMDDTFAVLLPIEVDAAVIRKAKRAARKAAKG